MRLALLLMEAGFNIERNLLVVKGSGSFVLADNKELFKHIIKVCSTNNLNQVIIDLREVEGHCLQFEFFALLEYASNLLKSIAKESDTSISIIFCAYSNIITDEDYANKLALSTGTDFRVTSSYDIALQWITEVKNT